MSAAWPQHTSTPTQIDTDHRAVDATFPGIGSFVGVSQQVRSSKCCIIDLQACTTKHWKVYAEQISSLAPKTPPEDVDHLNTLIVDIMHMAAAQPLPMCNAGGCFGHMLLHKFKKHTGKLHRKTLDACQGHHVCWKAVFTQTQAALTKIWNVMEHTEEFPEGLNLPAELDKVASATFDPECLPLTMGLAHTAIQAAMALSNKLMAEY